MPGSNTQELVKRIAKLAKQNQDLEDQVKKLEKINDKLTRDNEKFKSLLEKSAPGGIRETIDGEKKERSLKFNMATVLYADIHGFSKVIEGIDSSAFMDELDEILF